MTLPLLSPTLLFTTVVLTSRAFQAYGEFDLLTQGGPYPQASTTALPYLVYGEGSPIKGDLGLQSATAVLLFVVLLVLSLRAVRRLREAGALWRLTRSPEAGARPGATCCCSPWR